MAPTSEAAFCRRGGSGLAPNSTYGLEARPVGALALAVSCTNLDSTSIRGATRGSSPSRAGHVTQGWRVQRVDHRDPLVPVEDIVRLIDVAGTATAAAYSRSDVVQALNEQQPAAVAFGSGQLVGVAIRLWRVAMLICSPWHCIRVGGTRASALRCLTNLTRRPIHHGALRMLALVEPGQVGEVAFAHQGFDPIDGLHFYVRSASMVPEELEIVERYGGHFPAAGLWEEMKGFSTTKELLERRIVAPLAHAEPGGQCRATSTTAVMLFGPPGTGKTSFARAMASRLSWAFVELHPSLLGHGTAGAAALRARWRIWRTWTAWCVSSTRRTKSRRHAPADPRASRSSTSYSRRFQSSSPARVDSW